MDEQTEAFLLARQEFSHHYRDNIISTSDADELIKIAKREAITELLALHKQDRTKVNSQCDTLINMSTVDRYIRSLG